MSTIVVKVALRPDASLDTVAEKLNAILEMAVEAHPNNFPVTSFEVVSDPILQMADLAGGSIKDLMDQITALEIRVGELYAAEVESTRIISDEAREAVFLDVANAIDPNEIVNDYVRGTTFCRGFNQYTDRRLLESWLDCNTPFGGAHRYLDTDTWKNHLSNDLGAVGVIAELLNKRIMLDFWPGEKDVNDSAEEQI